MRKPQQSIIPLAVLALVLGILSGWIRLGWNVPLSLAAGEHGLIMVGGFLGTLISLERAVMVPTRWALLVPLAQALGVAALLMGAFVPALWLFIAGAVGMTLIVYSFLIRFQEPFYYLLLLGSVALVIGHIILVRSHFYPTVVTWWMAFLLLTITAERLELSRFVSLSPSKRWLLWGAIGLFLIGVVQPFHGSGQAITGIGMVAVSLWLLRFDMARRLVHRTGQHRYMGALLLLGYGWLLISGLLMALPISFPFVYDATLHAFFTGFVFAMIFAHGPVILPGVLGLRGSFFHPVLYIGSLGQMVGLTIRLLGDWQSYMDSRLLGGVVQGISIALFFVALLILIFRSRQRKPVTSTASPAYLGR